MATMANWTFNFLVSYFFLQMTSGIGKDGTFFIHAFFGVPALAFFVVKVPETKGRSLEQIESDIRGDTASRSSRAA